MTHPALAPAASSWPCGGVEIKGSASVRRRRSRRLRRRRARGEQMAYGDAWKASHPDFKTPFASVEDAITRGINLDPLSVFAVVVHPAATEPCQTDPFEPYADSWEYNNISMRDSDEDGSSTRTKEPALNNPKKALTFCSGDEHTNA